MTQSTESQANRDECVFPCRFSIWQVQRLGLLRDTKHIDVALLATARTFSRRRLAIFGHHVPSVENPQN